ncbi:MAG: hypothetical protein ACOYM1_12230 [Methylovulum sp.]
MTLKDALRGPGWKRKKIEKEAPTREQAKKEAPIKKIQIQFDLQHFSVGMSSPISFPGEGPRLLMQKCGLTVLLNINNPDCYEINALANSSHQMKIGYTPCDRLGILILDFKGFTFDLPFDAGIESHENIPDLTIKSEQSCVSLSIVSADSANFNKVIGIRHITMSPRVSRLVAEKIQKQAANPISIGTYDALVDQTYRKYPTTKHLIKIALAFDKAGQD